MEADTPKSSAIDFTLRCLAAQLAPYTAKRAVVRKFLPANEKGSLISPDALCLFGYSYIMYYVEYYSCGGAV